MSQGQLWRNKEILEFSSWVIAKSLAMAAVNRFSATGTSSAKMVPGTVALYLIIFNRAKAISPNIVMYRISYGREYHQHTNLLN
jgi:hypothetical protein